MYRCVGNWVLGVRGWGLGETQDWRSPNPHQHFAVFVNGDTFGVDQIRFKVLDVLIIDTEAAFEHSIGYPPLALQQLSHLRQGFLEGHRLPSLVTDQPTRSDVCSAGTPRLRPLCPHEKNHSIRCGVKRLRSYPSMTLGCPNSSTAGATSAKDKAR